MPWEQQDHRRFSASRSSHLTGRVACAETKQNVLYSVPNLVCYSIFCEVRAVLAAGPWTRYLLMKQVLVILVLSHSACPETGALFGSIGTAVCQTLPNLPRRGLGHFRRAQVVSYELYIRRSDIQTVAVIEGYLQASDITSNSKEVAINADDTGSRGSVVL